MRKLWLLATALLIAASASAETVHREIVYRYDFDDDSNYEFCVLSEKLSDGRYSIETSGSSTTITGTTAADDAFNQVNIGDLLFIDYEATTYKRVVVTNADADTITVDDAIDLSNATISWRYRSISCGTADTSGWFDVSNVTDRVVTISVIAIDQILNYYVDCRLPGTEPMQVWPSNVPSDGQHDTSDAANGTFAADVDNTREGRLPLQIPEPWTECRVGFQAASAMSAVTEVSVNFGGERER